MKFYSSEYKKYFRNSDYVWSTTAALILLIASIILNFYAGIYASEVASSSVTDIILSNIPAYDLDGIFIYGPLLLWIFVTGLCLIKPQRIPFILKSTALLVFVRSIFISLTHIGPFVQLNTIISPASFINWFTFNGDLFFSGHTGFPFLLALIFWENKNLRIFFITLAIFFGIIVLLAHLHYTIDVVAAFFITHSIFCVAEKMFKKDRKIFFNGLNN